MPQDQVRVMRDGAAAVLPRSQVSQEEIAAVTAPPPAPFKEPKPGEAADFTGQARRDYVTIPDAAGLIHKKLAGESIGAWVSAALENHQPVTATVNGKPRTIVAVDAGNMLLDSNGQALDPYRLVFGDPKGTVLSIGLGVQARSANSPAAPQASQFAPAALTLVTTGSSTAGTPVPPLSTSTAPKATLGTSTSNDYAATFSKAYPDVPPGYVHHAIEQVARKKYPNIITESQMHSIQNLRGIPEMERWLHLSVIRKEWNMFYRLHPVATLLELLKKADEIDEKYGHLFNPPIKR